MISGFSGMKSVSPRGDYIGNASNLPIPFNIPKVLQNLLYGDIDFEFDQRQKDILQALKFSYESLIKMEKNYALKIAEVQEKLVDDSSNKELQQEYEDLKLDLLEARYQFKELVSAMSEVMTKEQYQKLLEYSNIPI
jgi:hypothetical protein